MSQVSAEKADHGRTRCDKYNIYAEYCILFLSKNKVFWSGIF